ncbi:hypothetical protein E4U31_007949 [Claviceps sp. LM219 group G6]|nr:hypothetical protein E4U31_007949 [Claviceps sp. LM219 group G6]
MVTTPRQFNERDGPSGHWDVCATSLTWVGGYLGGQGGPSETMVGLEQYAKGGISSGQMNDLSKAKEKSHAVLNPEVLTDEHSWLDLMAGNFWRFN